jgi:copper resistance protein B
MSRVQCLIAAVTALGVAVSVSAMDHGAPNRAAPFGAPVDDQHVYMHVLGEQLEYRRESGGGSSRWEGEAWLGNDTHRLWLKSEGVLENGDVRDGQHEILYDRPIRSFFDVQAGLRYDLDAKPGRAWAALGIEGLAPYFLHVSATVYASDAGHFAAKAQGSYELLVTQRLILQPQLEVNLYTADDAKRRTGPGLADLDAGLRLRYEIHRKFAPYLGVNYERAFGRTARYARADGEATHAFNVLIGIRAWY